MDVQCDDRGFGVTVVASTPNPQSLVYLAMHQDYSEGWVTGTSKSEAECGEVIVARLLGGGRGHYGPLEHPTITFSVGGFPHSVMQQARTHRVGVSFDVQSGRYTGARVAKLGDAPIAEASDIEAVYYLRPVGSYCCPNSGRRYSYIEADREQDLAYCLTASRRYARAIAGGLSSEQARALLPFDLRQHFVVSFNLRSLMHFLDLRSKADAQLEIQALCDMIYPHFEVWAPQVATWYGANRLGKAKLAP